MLYMAECGHSSLNHHSSGVAAVSGENSNSPQSRRASLPSPLPQVVRGEQEPTWVVRHSPPSPASLLSSQATSIQEQTPLVDSSATQVARSPLPLPPENSASTQNSDENHVNTASQNKSPAWNKPSNGAAEVGPVMEAVASPALSESTEASPKFQDESSSRVAADGSTTTPQVPANLLHPQNHFASNVIPNSTPNHAMPVRQRFNQHGIHNGNGGRHPRGGFVRPSQTPSFPMFRVPHNGYGNLVPPVPDTYLRESSYQNNNWNPRPFRGYYPHSRPVNYDHGMSQSGIFNPYMHRYNVHQNNGNRLELVHGSFVDGRNVHMHHQRPHPRSFGVPSSSYMPPDHFFSPQPVTAYGNHMFYQGFDYYQPVPFDAFALEHYRVPQFVPQQPIVQSISEPPVSTLLVNQINYYFCDDNLVCDHFLRLHMDDEGWVSIHLIASFPRVKALTNDIPLILDSLRASTVVEVRGDKVRRRNDWIKWILKRNPKPDCSVLPSESSQNLLTDVQNLKIEDVVSDRTSVNGHEDSILEDGIEKIKELPKGEDTPNVDTGQ